MEKTEITPEPQSTTTRVGHRKKESFLGRHWKKICFLVIVLIVIIGSGIMGHSYGDKIAGIFSDESGSSNNKSKVSGEIKELPKIVAVVNKEQITKEQFEIRVNLSSQSYALQGVDVSTTEAQTQIRENVIQSMINERIILQNVAKEGITIPKEKIDEQLSSFVEQSGGAEAFVKAVQSQGISEDYVRSDITIQLLIQEYLSQKVDFKGIEITDEQIAQGYETAKANAQDQSIVPTLDEAKEEIRAQLIAIEEQNRTNEHVDSLRQSSAIEILF